MTMRFSGPREPWKREAPDRTWKQLLVAASEYVSTEDAQRIVEEVSGYSRGELVQSGDEQAPAVAAASVENMVTQRVSGVPLQYVLGSWGFRSLELFVDHRVLIPRPETEVVAEVAIAAARERTSPTVVDLGTGSGAIGLSIAVEVPGATVVLTDISDDALAVAKANVAGVGSAGSRVSLCAGSWFAALDKALMGTIDVIVSNPPYIAEDETLPDEVSNYEPRDALISGVLGTEHLTHLITEAPNWLRPGGLLVLEAAPHQLEALATLAKSMAFDVSIIADLAGKPRVLRAQLAQ